MEALIQPVAVADRLMPFVWHKMLMIITLFQSASETMQHGVGQRYSLDNEEPRERTLTQTSNDNENQMRSDVMPRQLWHSTFVQQGTAEFHRVATSDVFAFSLLLLCGCCAEHTAEAKLTVWRKRRV